MSLRLLEMTPESGTLGDIDVPPSSASVAQGLIWRLAAGG
jgi:hypothetical protein